MKKNVLLNSMVSHTIARMGHTQGVVIADAGLPIPSNVERIDLAVTHGIPAFLDVLDAVRDELCIEKIILAEEIKEKNAAILKEIQERFPDMETEFMMHEEFKVRTASCEAIIRTGEVTPYANIILISGVPF